jgi:hypothetical protein
MWARQQIAASWLLESLGAFGTNPIRSSAAASEDGIAFAKLGMEISCGSYFLFSSRKRENYNAIAKAVEFFGGRLIIDWQDE